MELPDFLLNTSKFHPNVAQIYRRHSFLIVEINNARQEVFKRKEINLGLNPLVGHIRHQDLYSVELDLPHVVCFGLYNQGLMLGYAICRLLDQPSEFTHDAYDENPSFVKSIHVQDLNFLSGYYPYINNIFQYIQTKYCRSDFRRITMNIPERYSASILANDEIRRKEIFDQLTPEEDVYKLADFIQKTCDCNFSLKKTHDGHVLFMEKFI